MLTLQIFALFLFFGLLLLSLYIQNKDFIKYCKLKNYIYIFLIGIMILFFVLNLIF